ncbi:MgtC/SapB family protein [Oscillibacter sp.]|uniref:MgtC/SapB family protein n=1 Tax=Oscillibacter sp. TaxID=1945593 RepID=UPI00289A297D|nr:MgtC/SapB family protein [Oscillibacter sp.]
MKLLDLLNPLREVTIASIFFRFLLATICGAVIGYERGKKRHAAGLRTHIVVCIGASSVMLLSQYLALFSSGNSDPARLGAQVISGIGFLGAGTIVITGHQRGQYVKGLTTAAGLWASACMGLAAGSGYYEAAVIMCVFLFSVIVILNRLDEKYLKDSTVMRFYIEYASKTPFSTILAEVRKNKWHMAHLEFVGGNNDSINSAIIDVQRTGLDSDRNALLCALRSTEGILFVEDA